MFGGIEVNDPLHVLWPLNATRVLRTGNDETPAWPHRRRCQQERIQSRLPIGAEGSEITKSPFFPSLSRKKRRGTSEKIYRRCHTRAIFALNQGECRTA